jgi:hypothetical protein
MARGPKRAMTDDMKTYICEQIAAGRSATDICADEQIGLDYRTMNRELHRDPYFMSEYARARELSIEPRVEENEAILRGLGEWADVAWEARKEIVNERRWQAIRLARFRYGDKIDVNANVKVTEGRVIDAEALDLDQLIAVREALVAAIEGPDEEYMED